MTADEIINKANPCNCSYPSKAFMVYAPHRNAKHRIACTRCGFDVQHYDLQATIDQWNDINNEVSPPHPNAIQTSKELPNEGERVLLWDNESQWQEVIRIGNRWLKNGILYLIEYDYWLPITELTGDITTGRTMQEWMNYWQQATEIAQAGKEDKTFGQAQDELLAKITDQTQAVSNALYALFVKKTADELPDELVDVLLWRENEWITAHRNSVMEWDLSSGDHYAVCNIEDGQYWLPLPTFNPESEG